MSGNCCHGAVNVLDETFSLLPQMLDSIVDEGRNYSKSIRNYYDILKGAHHQITAQAAKITRNVEADLELEGISESEVRIFSKITQQDYWQELQNFVELYEKWNADEFKSLPSEDYLSSIKEVARLLLAQGHKEKIELLNLLNIELRLKEDSDTKTQIIRTDQELHDSSSHGMAYLILCKFLLAFTRMLRGAGNTYIHWPIDELGTLHVANIEKIFKACERNKIIIVGALPNPDLSILRLFEYRYRVSDDKKSLESISPPMDKLTAIIEAKKQKELAHE